MTEWRRLLPLTDQHSFDHSATLLCHQYKVRMPLETLMSRFALGEREGSPFGPVLRDEWG